MLHLRWLVVLALAGTSQGQLSAAIVLLKDQAEPLVGTIISEDRNRVVIRIAEGGKTRDETIPHENVEEIVAPYSPKRLADLDPSQPKAYRDYAEELQARRRDPEARDMAMRLYLMAAWLDREALVRSGLLGMISLARSPEEEKKFRSTLFLIDPRTPLHASKAAASGAEVSAAQDLLRAMRFLRTGKGITARTLTEKPAVAKLLESYGSILTKAELNRAAGQTTLSPRELRQVLLLELEMEAIVHPSSATERSPDQLTWSRDLQGDGGKPVPSFSLETLTEFNPRECWYRDGEWVERP